MPEYVVRAVAAPTEEERQSYYIGVEGSLLARTSTHRLPLREPFPQKKRFQTIGNHEILSAWSPELATSIKAALKGINWTRFYPIRLGVPDTWDDWVPKAELILMVDVVPGSTTEKEACRAAFDCHELLKEANLLDVEVELREVLSVGFVGSTALPDIIDPIHWDEIAPEIVLRYLYPSKTLNELISSALPEFIGFEISPQEGNFQRGTMGPIIKLSGRPGQVFGLTCRHVIQAFDDDSPWVPINEGYSADGIAPEKRHYVVTPGKDFFWHLSSTLARVIKELTPEKLRYKFEETRSMAEPDRFIFNEVDERALALCSRSLSYAEKLQTFLETEEPEPTVIGHVAFMPAGGVSPTGFLRDWALIRLDKPAVGSAPANKIVLRLGLRQNFPAYDRQQHGVVLSGVESWGPCRARASMRVAKRGVMTGFTFGTTNEIKAVVRNPKGDMNELCWDWIVVSPPGDHRRAAGPAFSNKGDSGACVFTLDGRLVGLLSGGAAALNVTTSKGRRTMSEMDLRRRDLTFVTPIDLLFEDIRRVTGCEPSLVTDSV